MDDLRVKKVDARDIRGITASNWRVFNEKNDISFKEDKFCFTVFDGERVVGAARCRILGGVMELTTIIVNRNFRRYGAGSALLEAVESLAKEKECTKIVLKTSEKHVEAIKFYENRGYTKVATLPDWFFGIDWFFYQKDI